MLEVGSRGLTDTEQRSHFALWAMTSAPPLTSRDLWTGATSTTSGAMPASAPAHGTAVCPSAEAAPSHRSPT
jgi:hypothetical protein